MVFHIYGYSMSHLNLPWVCAPDISAHAVVAKQGSRKNKIQQIYCSFVYDLQCYIIPSCLASKAILGDTEGKKNATQ